MDSMTDVEIADLGADRASNRAHAAERVDFRLTYALADPPRRCHGAGIEGPEIPDSRRDSWDPDDPYSTSSGDWYDPGHPPDIAPEADHITRWFITAIAEATHEALEWFKVDGKPMLDPHGPDEDVIHDLTHKFGAALAALANGDDT